MQNTTLLNFIANQKCHMRIRLFLSETPRKTTTAYFRFWSRFHLQIALRAPPWNWTLDVTDLCFVEDKNILRILSTSTTTTSTGKLLKLNVLRFYCKILYVIEPRCALGLDTDYRQTHDQSKQTCHNFFPFKNWNLRSGKREYNIFVWLRRKSDLISRGLRVCKSKMFSHGWHAILIRFPSSPLPSVNSFQLLVLSACVRLRRLLWMLSWMNEFNGRFRSACEALGFFTADVKTESCVEFIMCVTYMRYNLLERKEKSNKKAIKIASMMSAQTIQETRSCKLDSNTMS